MPLHLLSTSAIAFASVSVVSSFRNKKTDQARSGKGVKIYLAGQDDITKWDKNQVGTEYWRPNYLKHERCAGDVCEECEAGEKNDYDCFISDKVNSKELKLKLDNTTWTKFISTFELKCPQAGALVEYEVTIDTKYNDDWKLFVNSVPEVPIKDEFDKFALHLGSVEHGQTMEVRVEFTAPDGFKYDGEEAGKLEIVGEGAVGEYLQCEDYEVCLVKLAGSSEGRGLRNKNQRQLECLTDTLGGTGNGNLQNACDSWRTCLRNNTMDGGGTLEDGILKLLQAGLQGGHGWSGNSHRSDFAGCVNPKFSDPEGWACNCLANWKQKCVDAGYGTHEQTDANCLTASFCAANMVCPSWKEGACNDAEVTAILADKKFSSSLVQQTQRAESKGALAQRANNGLRAKTHASAATLEESTGAKSCI